MDFRIHIFCGTSNLCRLLSKSFGKEPYLFECTEVKDESEGKKTKLEYEPDCIIFDKDIELDLKDEIINKYDKSKIILLPSLNVSEQMTNARNVFQISEPFKLSELSELLKEIYHSKQIEESTT